MYFLSQRFFVFLLPLSISGYASTHAAAAAYVEIKNQRFEIEIVDNDASRARGLMFRENLAEGHGMLFIFENSEPRSFWMKNTKIPLDILFFDSAKKLINVQQRVPPCRMDPCPGYSSTAPAQYVLELNAGVAEKLGVKAGDELQIQL